MIPLEIIPAVLPDSFEELEDRLGLVSRLARIVHLDADDGVFVPHISWPYRSEDAQKFNAIVREEEGMPYWDKLDYEVHLMVANPESKALDWVRAGAMRIIAHVEAVKDLDVLRDTIGSMTELVLALKLETPLDTVEPFRDRIDGVHLMTIPRIGFQAIEFDASGIAKLKEARKKFPHLPISVDGGIDSENAKALVDAGANRLIVGSAIFDSEDPIKKYKELKETVGGVQ